VSRARQAIMWIVLGFIAYVIVTRPAVAADAANAIWRGIVNAANALATFLDGLIPK
jgi:hypothetical protein